MIIADLDYIDSVSSEKNSLCGGVRKKYITESIALAIGRATAMGGKLNIAASFTETYTSIFGSYSSSRSTSYSSK